MVKAEAIIEIDILSKNSVRTDLDASEIMNYLQQNKLLLLFIHSFLLCVVAPILIVVNEVVNKIDHSTTFTRTQHYTAQN